MKKRVVSLLLCLIMALSLIPTTAFAVGTSSQDDGISLTSIVQPDDQSYYTYEFYLSRDSREPYSTQIVKEGEKLYQPETPTTPEGKVFTGWYDEAGNPFTGFGEIDEITESDTIKLTARIEDGYYVFFKKTDGTVIDTKTGTTGAEISLNSVSFPVEADQAITGWYKDGSLTESASNPVIIGTSNISLYAKVETGHWITFDSDGGSYVEPKFFATSKNTEKPNDPAKPGYAFAGWNTENGTAYTFGSPLTESITLKAKWTAKDGVPYTVIHWQENANDNGYSFAESERLIGVPGELTEDAVDKSYEGFTLNQDKTDAQKTIAGDGSTIVNVYYKRNVYKIIFASNSQNGPDRLCGKEEHRHTYEDSRWSLFGGTKYKGGCYPANSYSRYPICGKEAHRHNNGCYGKIYEDLTITAKYGAYIGNKWPTYNGSNTWAVERNGDTYQANINTMPLGGATFYGPETGKNTETAYYYVEVLPGESGTLDQGKYYKQHHSDTSVGKGFLVTDEDKYPITGFTYDHGTKNQSSYNNANFYYTRNSYKIVFMNNGQEKTVSRKYEQSIANDSYTPTAPEGKEGYKFAGWYDNELCEGKEYTFTGKTMPAQNITLYAKWVAPVHTVTVYDSNRTTVLATLKKAHKSTIDMNKEMPKYTAPEGYEFLGWVLLEDGTPFNFNTQITRDYKLYAKIGSTATYTVTYYPNGGSGTMKDNTKYAEGAIASVMANGFTPPNDDKVFLCWSTTASGSVAYYANSQLKITGNMTLYAIWGDKDSTVTLTYNANYEGANPATNTINNIKNNAKVTLKQFTELFPARDGYQFTGWNTQADGKGDSFDANERVHVDKVDPPNVLYAQWEQLTGSLTIKKEVEGLSGTAVPDSFNFEVSDSNNTQIATVYATDNWTTTLTDLTPGRYRVTEKNTDAQVNGYDLEVIYSNNGEANVTAGATPTVTVINKYTKINRYESNVTPATLTITKVDKDNNNTKLTGAVFQLRDKDGKVYGEFAEDGNGVYTISNIKVEEVTRLYLYETTAPAGYETPTDAVAEFEAKLETSGTEWKNTNNNPNGAWVTTGKTMIRKIDVQQFDFRCTIEITNNKLFGDAVVNPASLTVIKTDAKDGSLLKGAKFVLIAEDKSEFPATTDKDGKAVFAGLTKGTYTLKEVTAPEGYQATDKIWTITVSDDAQTAGYVLKDGKFVKTVTCKVDDVKDVVANGSITITNAKNTGTLTINKVLKGLNATDFEDGFAFDIKDASGKVVATVEKVFPGMPQPATVTLAPGKYTIVEKSADVKDYDLTTEYDKETFTVEAGKNVIVTVTNTYTKKVTPPPAEYTLSVDIQKNIELKRSSSRKPGKASFTFEAYLVDEKGNETILDTVTIDTKGTKSADGTLTFTLTEDDLSVTGHGTVYVREVKGSTRGWTYDDTVYALGVELTTDGKLNIISVDTKRIDKPATLEFTNVYYKRSTTTGGGDKPIQSVKTGDMGIAMYAMTSLLSLGGAALVIKKRKEEK